MASLVRIDALIDLFRAVVNRSPRNYPSRSSNTASRSPATNSFRKLSSSVNSAVRTSAVFLNLSRYLTNEAPETESSSLDSNFIHSITSATYAHLRVCI